MKEELIFHLVTEKDWKEYKNNSVYSPQSLETDGFIHCSSGEDIQEIANRYFKSRDDVLLLVINTTLVDREIKYEKDQELDKEFPHIYGSINTGAVVDRIHLAPEANGSFDIVFESK